MTNDTIDTVCLRARCTKCNQTFEFDESLKEIVKKNGKHASWKVMSLVTPAVVNKAFYLLKGECSEDELGEHDFEDDEDTAEWLKSVDERLNAILDEFEIATGTRKINLNKWVVDRSRFTVEEEKEEGV